MNKLIDAVKTFLSGVEYMEQEENANYVVTKEDKELLQEAIDTVVAELEKDVIMEDKLMMILRQLYDHKINIIEAFNRITIKETMLDKSTNVVISESEYCDCEYPTLGKSVSCCGNCGRYFKKKGI